MSYCLNAYCPNPENPGVAIFCVSCGTKLLLKERYRAIKPIGQGGFGRTFLAVDEDKPSKPPCVIKQFFPLAQGTSSAHKAAELFNLEAVQLDELGKHPQIPDLLAYFTQEDRQYLVQEFIDGQTLSQELAQKGALNEIQIRQLLNDLLPVLQFVHSQQVIHRDIKPDNIIRRKSDSKLFLVDFGASKNAAGTVQQTGTSIGSPEYVAPEQSRGRAVFASDIYSLGVTCVHLLTQMSPFDLYDLNQDGWVWRKFLKNPISDRLASIFDKMLESAINRRYQSVAEVLKDLNVQTPGTPAVKAQTPSKPPVKSPSPPPVANTPAASRKSEIDRDLQEMKSQFLENNSSKSQVEKTEIEPQAKEKKSQSLGNSSSKSQIDLDLEDLRSQFGSQKGEK